MTLDDPMEVKVLNHTLLLVQHSLHHQQLATSMNWSYLHETVWPLSIHADIHHSETTVDSGVIDQSTRVVDKRICRPCILDTSEIDFSPSYQ